MAPHPICIDSGWFRHQIYWKAACTTSPQNTGSELWDNSQLVREKIRRNIPCMELWWTAFQYNLPYIHEWVHRQVAHEIWTLLTTEITALTAHTSWGDIWSQRTTDPWRRQESTTRQRRYQTHPGHCWGTVILCKSSGCNLLVGLSSIGDQQAVATERTNEAINQLLDYSAIYPVDGILYRSSDMVLCAHSDTGFHNESKGRSRLGAHIFLSKNGPMPLKRSSSHSFLYYKICHVLLFRSRTGGTFHYSPRDGSNKKHAWGNEVAPSKITHPDRQLSRSGSSQ